MALDLKNNNSNSKSSALGSKPTGSLTASPTPAGAQVEVIKPAPADPDPPSQFELRPPRFWLVLAIVVVAVAVGLLTLYFKIGTKGPKPDQTSQNAALSTPVSHEAPTPPPAISNEDEKKVLADYFLSVSTIFKPEYMDKIPQVAAGAFKNYQAASGDEKLEAARTFYIYLNSPGVDSSDPLFAEFVDDVQLDLEKALGRDLF